MMLGIPNQSFEIIQGATFWKKWFWSKLLCSLAAKFHDSATW